MSTPAPTPLEMAYYYASHLDSEEADLDEALYELNRAFLSRWSDDLPRAIRELLPVLESYRRLVGSLVCNLEEAATDKESEGENGKNTPAPHRSICGTNNG